MNASNTAPRPTIVLLVDDQRFVGTVVERLLATEADIELHCCEQPAEAVARANDIRPSVILQDLVMPGVDGLTLVARYRSNPATAETPVVVLSGNDCADSRAQALAAGAADYLVKLPARDALIACIRRYARRMPIVDDGSPVAVPAPDPVRQAPGGEPTIDLVVIAAYRQGALAGSPDFTTHLIDQFLLEADGRVAAIRSAAGQREMASVKSAAHGLKGSASIMGARRLSALCGQIEGRANTAARPSVVSALVAALDEELVRVREALAQERS